MNPRRTDSTASAWFQSVNCDGFYGVALCVALALIWIPMLGGDFWRAQLRYDRIALGAGQWWRLISAHVVHLSYEHAALNSAGLLLLWVLFAREFSPWRWLLIVGASAAAIDAGLWLFAPGVVWYVGASGVLHGVLAAGAYAACVRHERFGIALALLLAVKLAYEHYSGASALAADLPVVLEAHLFGAAGGLLAVLIPVRAPKPL